MGILENTTEFEKIMSETKGNSASSPNEAMVGYGYSREAISKPVELQYPS